MGADVFRGVNVGVGMPFCRPSSRARLTSRSRRVLFYSLQLSEPSLILLRGELWAEGHRATFSGRQQILEEGTGRWGALARSETETTGRGRREGGWEDWARLSWQQAGQGNPKITWLCNMLSPALVAGTTLSGGEHAVI